MTDDVKALIDEACWWGSALNARANTLGEQLKRPGVADTFAEEEHHHELATSAHLIDRLATVLSTAESAGYARGIEEAAKLAESYAQAQTMWAANVSDPAQKKQFNHGRDAIDGVAWRIRALKQEKN